MLKHRRPLLFPEASGAERVLARLADKGQVDGVEEDEGDIGGRFARAHVDGIAAYRRPAAKRDVEHSVLADLDAGDWQPLKGGLFHRVRDHDDAVGKRPPVRARWQAVDPVKSGRVRNGFPLSIHLVEVLGDVFAPEAARVNRYSGQGLLGNGIADEAAEDSVPRGDRPVRGKAAVGRLGRRGRGAGRQPEEA